MPKVDLRKKSRSELLQMLVEQSRQMRELRAELQSVQAQLDSRSLRIAESGTLAEAALSIYHLFEAADEAAKLYLENVRSSSVPPGPEAEDAGEPTDAAEEPGTADCSEEPESGDSPEAILRDARRRAAGIIEAAEKLAESIVKEAENRARSGEETDESAG